MKAQGDTEKIIWWSRPGIDQQQSLGNGKGCYTGITERSVGSAKAERVMEEEIGGRDRGINNTYVMRKRAQRGT